MNAVARPTLAASPTACVARRTAAVRKPAAARPARVVVSAAQKQEVAAPVAFARKHALAAATSLSVFAAANPAMAQDLFSPESQGAVTTVGLVIVGGVVVISTLFLPIVTGTLNPLQMAVNLGITGGEISNDRKFKRNGEPMDHGGTFGHKWYDTDAYCNGKYIDFCGTKKTGAEQDKEAK